MTEEIKTCDFYNDKICNLFTEYFKFKVECKNLSLCTVDDDTEKECPYKQLKQAENTVNECHKYLAELEDKIESLEQENKELKKQIESDKGLITVGGKQQYKYLQRINELEQENKALKEKIKKYSAINEQDTKDYAELKQENKELKDINNRLQAIIDDGLAENKRFREENKELKTCIEMIENTEGQAHIEGVRLAKENKNYHSALEEIRKIVTSAFAKQRPYKKDFAEIENIINKILNKG